MSVKSNNRLIKSKKQIEKRLNCPAKGLRQLSRSCCITPFQANRFNDLGGLCKYVLDIVVQMELVRMRAHSHGIDFVLLLVSDPGINEIFFENSAFEEELVIRSERREPPIQRTLQRWDPGGFLSVELVDVFIERLSRMDFFLHSIEACHQHGRKRQIGIARWIGWPELETFRFRAS